MKTLAAIFFSSCSVFSATLDCQTLINLDIVNKSIVETEFKSKKLIVELPQVKSFVTEMDRNRFSVEAYIPSLDARIYSEGSIQNSQDRLSAIVWSRDILIDVVCQKKQ